MNNDEDRSLEVTPGATPDTPVDATLTSAPPPVPVEDRAPTWDQVAPPTAAPAWGAPGTYLPSAAIAASSRPWYRKKRVLIPGTFVVLALIGTALPDAPVEADKSSARGGGDQPVAQATVDPAVVEAERKAAEEQAAAVEAARKRAEQQAAADAKASAEAQAKAEAAARAAAARPYVALSARDFAKLIKDPDAHAGRRYVIHGEVSQFDAATGDEAFLANVGHKKLTPSYGYVSYDERALLAADASKFADVVEGDLFTAKVEVEGSFSYDTQIGGNTTVAKFNVTSISVYGSTKQ